MTSRAKSATGLKHKQSTKPIRNFTNPRLHEGLTQANTYSGRVQTHLLTSKFENHVLDSACRGFVDKDYKRSRVRSQSAACLPLAIGKTSSKNLQQLGRPSSSRKNPQAQDNNSTDYATVSLVNNFGLIRGALNYKAQIVPEYSQTLKDLCTKRTSLHEQIKKLKAGINSEKKKIAKINLNCNKISNQNEETQKNFLKKQQQNYHLSVQIAKIQIQCTDLCQNIDELNQNLQIRKNQVKDERDLRDKVKRYVDETRMDVLKQQKQVGRYKQRVTSVYNIMSSCYMKQNQLKQQKASLITDINAKYGKYT